MNREEIIKEIEKTLNDKTLCYEDTTQRVEVLQAQLKGFIEGKKEEINDEINFLISICKFPTMYTSTIVERISKKGELNGTAKKL